MSDTNPYLLPPDLPVPIDDGACDHLQDMEVPPVTLVSTRNRFVNVRDISLGQAVFFFYPRTGKPGRPILKAWNDIPGARGCTPECCAYRDYYGEFRQLRYEVFGVSAQSLEDQIDFATRNNVPHELLNDSNLQLVSALRLPTFEFESKTYIKRLTLIVRKYRIEKVFYPVFPPHKNAEEVLQYLKEERKEKL